MASGVALTLVYMFVVVPLKSGHLPGDMVGLFGDDYVAYQGRVGMLTPKLRRRTSA